MTKHSEFNTETLLKAVEDLESQLKGNADRIAIGVETDLDEAFFIGTPQAFVRMAVALLRAATNKSYSQEVANVKCEWSEFTYDAIDPLAQVAVGAECTVRTDEERQLLVQFFRNLTGDNNGLTV